MNQNEFLALGVMMLFTVTKNTALIRKLTNNKLGLITLYASKTLLVFLYLWIEMRNMSSIIRLLIAFWFAYETSTFFKALKKESGN